MGINFSEVSFAYYVPRKKQKVRFVLKNINLNIKESGEMIALVGHTGSGKSTLVQLMNALLMPTSGEIKIMNERLTRKTKLKPIRKKSVLFFSFPSIRYLKLRSLKTLRLDRLISALKTQKKKRGKRQS